MTIFLTGVRCPPGEMHGLWACPGKMTAMWFRSARNPAAEAASRKNSMSFSPSYSAVRSPQASTGVMNISSSPETANCTSAYFLWFSYCASSQVTYSCTLAYSPSSESLYFPAGRVSRSSLRRKSAALCHSSGTLDICCFKISVSAVKNTGRDQNC